MTKTERLEAKAAKLYPKLINRAMARKLASGEAINVELIGTLVEHIGLGDLGLVGTWYLGEKWLWEGYDLCVGKGEAWVWSVGKRKTDGKIFAALDERFYGRDDFECLWLR